MLSLTADFRAEYDKAYAGYQEASKPQSPISARIPSVDDHEVSLAAADGGLIFQRRWTALDHHRSDIPDRTLSSLLTSQAV
jgi:hypothetical protein